MAKRQTTWFRKERLYTWLDATLPLVRPCVGPAALLHAAALSSQPWSCALAQRLFAWWLAILGPCRCLSRLRLQLRFIQSPRPNQAVLLVVRAGGAREVRAGGMPAQRRQRKGNRGGLERYSRIPEAAVGNGGQEDEGLRIRAPVSTSRQPAWQVGKTLERSCWFVSLLQFSGLPRPNLFLGCLWMLYHSSTSSVSSGGQ